MAAGPETLGVSHSFLRVIANRPDGDGLMRAVLHGPMSGYRPIAAALHTIDDGRENLLLTGHDGFTSQIARFDSVPVTWDFPHTRAFRDGATLLFDGSDLDGEFPLLGPMADLLVLAPPDVLKAFTLIAVPIVYSARLLGVCTIITRPDGPWTWSDYAQIDGLGSAVSLWQAIENLTHRQVTLNAKTGVPRLAPGGLSLRQLAILSMIQSGKSNTSIAKALGYSVSTVKAEVQHLLSLFSVANRRDLVRKASLAGLVPPATDDQVT